MNLTEQQEALASIPLGENAAGIACAGSGKTSTSLAYISRHSNKSKLMVCFNNSVQKETALKVQMEGIPFTHVSTAHSLAFSHVGNKYKLEDITAQTILNYLGMKANGHNYKVCRLILELFSGYCKSLDASIPEFLRKYQAKTEDSSIYMSKNSAKMDKIITDLWNHMESGAIGITHDFYMKKFQLLDFKLNYDIIVFDEFQDANPILFDIFSRQKATKMVLGDPFQSIYQFTGAIDAFSYIDYPRHYLSNSFRFPQYVADVAMEVLDWYSKIDRNFTLPYEIKGLGHARRPAVGYGGHSCCISRTNMGLLSKAFDIIEENPEGTIYIAGSNGNLNSFLYTADQISIYDILNFYGNKKDRIKHPLMLSFETASQFNEYINDTEDNELDKMRNLYTKYKSALWGMIPNLKTKLVLEQNRADRILTTAHKAKGLEWDTVELLEDFMPLSKFNETLGIIRHPDMTQKTTKHTIESLKQEINLTYVAVTRAKRILNESLELDGSLPPEIQGQNNVPASSTTIRVADVF